MKMRRFMATGVALAMAAGLLSACGGGGGSSSPAPTPVPTKGQTGKVIQGPVSGATVWADSLEGGAKFTIDANESASKTTTSLDGTFQLPVQPSYKHIIVSQGGTDTLTNQPASTMLAPAGAKACSPLTTLVTLDTSGTLAAKINALLPAGTSFDSDLSASNALSPAALLLLKSIETTVMALNTTITTVAGSGKISPAQQSNIQLLTYSKITEQLNSMTSTEIQTPSLLATGLTTAVTNSITAINTTTSSNVTISNVPAVAAAVATNAVASAAQVVGAATSNAALQSVTAANVSTSTTAVTATSSVTEATALNPSAVIALNNSVNTIVTTQSGSVVATQTPTNYIPPPIPVVQNPTITGMALSVLPSSSNWSISSFTITFSDDMLASTTTGANSVLNPANYILAPAVCTPSTYAAKVVTFSCPATALLTSGSILSVTVKKTVSSTTNAQMLVDYSKTFTIPAATTGSTGGSGTVLF